MNFNSMEEALQGMELIDEDAQELSSASAVSDVPTPEVIAPDAGQALEATALENSASTAEAEEMLDKVVTSQVPVQENKTIPSGDLMSILDVARQGTPNPNVTNLSPADPQTNTLSASIPEGMTQIPGEMMQQTVGLVAQAFPSMNQVGMLLDIQDRMAYAMSVMGNQNLRSDIKAQIADQVMRDGKILLEALPRDWYEARNMIIPQRQ